MVPSRYVDVKYILGDIGDKVHIGQELATTRQLNKVPFLSFSFPPADFVFTLTSKGSNKIENRYLNSNHMTALEG